MRRRLIQLLTAAAFLICHPPAADSSNSPEAPAPKSVTVCDVFMWNGTLVAKYADVFYKLDPQKGTSQKLELPLFPVLMALGKWEDRPLAMGRDGDRFKIFDRRGDTWHELILPSRAHMMGEKVRLCAYKKSFAVVGENSAFLREDNHWREIGYHRMPECLFDKVKVCQERHYYALSEDVIWRAYGNLKKGGLCKISLTDGNWTEVPLDGPMADLPVTGLKYDKDGKLYLSQGTKDPAKISGDARGIVRCLENGVWKTVFTAGKDGEKSSIQAISFDAEDNLCMATANAGILSRSKTGTLKKLTAGTSWPQDLIPVTVLRTNDMLISGTNKGSVLVECGKSPVKTIPL